VNTRVQELFYDLADLSAEERARYLAEHTVDEETRREVEALLAFDVGPNGSLANDIGVVAGQVLTLLEAKGRRCGPYRLTEVIGRGGMGTVYLAERADGEVTQQVAVKMLGAFSDDPLRRERFLQERQILASLAHPNIARMMDAGHLEDGQPFLAMEYVDGRPIDVFAAELGIRQKVALLLPVCAAVGYLHRNLVVHRDLKPSNILITAGGDPKLLDFGIAKILDLATDSTMTGMRMLTPDYASPEQVAGGRVSTATDIYSLGAVLYKLLTGRTAHQFEDHSLQAMAAASATREVVRPSQWDPELKGDLDAILLKALRRDPQERYATAEQLAEDLQAFLDSRPVKARSGNAWYRTRMFVRRRWAPLVAAGLVMASLAAGLFVANRQRLAAERRFSQLRQFAHRVMFEVNPDLGAIPDAINAQSKLLAITTQYLEGLSVEAIHDKELALEVARSYLQVARIQGVPAWNNLGQYGAVEESLRKADRFIGSVLAAEPHNRDALWLAANAAHDCATVADAQHHTERVPACAQTVAARFDELARLGTLVRREFNGAAYMYGDLAEIFNGMHRFEDAVRYGRRGVAVSNIDPASVPGPRAQSLAALAGALMNLGDVPGALEAIRQARELVDHGSYNNEGYRRSITLIVLWREGQILGEDGGVNLNRPAEAAARFRQAFDPMEEMIGKSPHEYHGRELLVPVGRYLGDVLRHSNPPEALKIYDLSLTRIREIPNDVEARREEAHVLASSSYAARWSHRGEDAANRIEEAFRLLRQTGDYPAERVQPDSEADTAVRALADHYAETGRPEKALETYQDLLRRNMASNPDPQNDLPNAAAISRAYASMAGLLRRIGRTDEAAAFDARRADLWREWQRKLPANPFVLRQLAEK